MVLPEVPPIETTGVILLNLGGPDSLGAVRPFLYNLFSDRQIIRLGPAMLQRPLAGLIAFLRAVKTRAMYRKIGGKSPILEITTAQARALEASLNKDRAHRRYIVRPGMRYWHPYIEDTAADLYSEGVRDMVALSLYPHYSLATSGSALSAFNNAVSRLRVRHVSVPAWYDHPRYIDALVDVISRGLARFPGGGAHILFSAHSLPMSIIEAGDPYVEHIKGTISAVMERIRLPWHLAYQSRSGPVRWLSPSTGEMLKELSGAGVRELLVVPVSFVSDHIETLYEIDILYRNEAEGFGVRLERAESLNTHPLFIEALRDLVLTADVHGRPHGTATEF